MSVLLMCMEQDFPSGDCDFNGQACFQRPVHERHTDEVLLDHTFLRAS